MINRPPTDTQTLDVLYDYYIQYPVPKQLHERMLPNVIALQAEIYRLIGVQGRLKKETGNSDMWMEIYEDVHQRLLFEGTMQTCVAQCRILDILPPGTCRIQTLYQDIFT